MKIIILTVGKVKNRLFKEAVLHYLEMAGKYVALEWVVLPDAVQKGNNDNGISKEGQSILRRVGERDFAVLLDERGRKYKSRDFSVWLEEKFAEIQGRIIFIVGGPYGVSNQVKNRADFLLSLSDMTFPHELCTVMLSEQLYRACTIKAGTGYHH